MSEQALTTDAPSGLEGSPDPVERFDWSAADDRLGRHLAGLAPGAALELTAELHGLRSAVEAATRVLDRVGFTTEAYEALDGATRRSDFWQDVYRVWSVRGPEPAGGSCVLRFTRSGALAERSFASPRAALEAAIEAIETNEAYPQAIEQDGTVLLDCAGILREWEERHIPG